MRIMHVLSSTLLGCALLSASAHARFSGTPQVTRDSPTSVKISWMSQDAVDVYKGNSAAASLAEAIKLGGNKNGSLAVEVLPLERPFFILVDKRDHQQWRVAERLLPLEKGSNFRDLGGYAAAGGKHVRWGLIFRSAGQPLLSDSDLQQIGMLGLHNLVDLRSSEERVIAPSKINDVPYTAVGYSFASLASSSAAVKNGAALYHRMPTFLAPHLRVVFHDLLSKQAPLAYNCSAGQDRTGFVTAMIYSALGVPRDVIVSDYHLSTTYRRPENEMPKFDAATIAANPIAGYFAKYQSSPQATIAQPLKEADGTPFLKGAFDEIEEKWGSVDNYLAREVGIGPVERARLRALYLE